MVSDELILAVIIDINQQPLLEHCLWYLYPIQSPGIRTLMKSQIRPSGCCTYPSLRRICQMPILPVYNFIAGP